MIFRFAGPALLFLLSAFGASACDIKSQDGAAQVIRYQVASGLCPYFKKQMGFVELSILLQTSNSITGIMDDYKAGEPYKACEALIGPFIKRTAQDWLKSDRAELCSSVKEDFDSKPMLRSIFTKLGLL